MTHRRQIAVLALGMMTALAGPSSAVFQSPQQAHEVSVVNIAVPVRVFDGDKFVDSLTIKDFEVYEDGVKQTIEAVYLIRGTSVERGSPGKKPDFPSALPRQLERDVQTRHFVLFFFMDEYLPQLNPAIDTFFAEVLSPRDTLRVVTSEESWQLRAEAQGKISAPAQAEQLKSRLRKSLTLAGSRLRSLLATLQTMAFDQKTSPEGFNPLGARDTLDQIVHLKTLDEARVARLAGFLRGLEGQKHVLLFYQRESLLIPPEFLAFFEEMATDRRSDAKPGKVKEIFADAGMTVHFLYITRTKPSGTDVEFQDSNLAMPVEMSGDFFQTFRTMAAATGGVAESSANPEFALRKAAAAVDNYYLLYYRPSASKGDGRFKKIEVKVKGGGYAVTHRAGYIDQ